MSTPPKNLPELLEALDRSTRQIKDMARKTLDGISRRSFAPYHAYRAAIDEQNALAVLIEARIEGLPSQAAAKVRERLLTSEREVLTLTIRSALEFFFALSAIPNLPIGIREVFAQELKALAYARERLRSDTFRDQLSPDLEMDVETAEEILREVMKKAPSLVDFDAPPSL